MRFGPPPRIMIRGLAGGGRGSRLSEVRRRASGVERDPARLVLLHRVDRRLVRRVVVRRVRLELGGAGVDALEHRARCRSALRARADLRLASCSTGARAAGRRSRAAWPCSSSSGVGARRATGQARSSSSISTSSRMWCRNHGSIFVRWWTSSTRHAGLEGVADVPDRARRSASPAC